MEMHGTDEKFEALIKELDDSAQMKAYKEPYDNYKPGLCRECLVIFLFFVEIWFTGVNRLILNSAQSR